jgi:hypothetical protein
LAVRKGRFFNREGIDSIGIGGRGDHDHRICWWR